MLDDFRENQKIAYKTIKNSIAKSKISHAYIIESNDYSKSFDFALAFAKTLLCPKNFTNRNEACCKNCCQCDNIEKNEFIELKVIDSSGMWIKKSQLDELQEMFSKKTVIGNKKIYIIKDADKLNESSSNSLLKFLEEPEDGIIAILIVKSVYQLINTIVSRCQILSLNSNINYKKNTTLERVAQILYNSEKEIKEYLENLNSVLKIQKVVEFVKYYEENHLDTFFYVNKLWHNNFSDKVDIYNAFTLMLLFYKDILNYLIGNNLEIYLDYEDDIKNISAKNSIKSLIKKIGSIIDLRDNIKYNINNNMIMDKLIIQLDGSEIYD